jgi:hypothetical protein
MFSPFVVRSIRNNGLHNKLKKINARTLLTYVLSSVHMHVVGCLFISTPPFHFNIFFNHPSIRAA